MSRIRLRLATDDDIRRFARQDRPEWVVEWVAYAAEQDGEVVALGMILWDSHGLTWVMYNSRIKLSPFLMHRLAKKTLGHLREIGVTDLYTFCDDAIPGADKWLARLGFRPSFEFPSDAPPVLTCKLT